MEDLPPREELEAVFAWEDVDLVPGQPEATAFRRRARYDQALWRASRGYPIGTQPINPHPNRPPARPVGSRVPLPYGLEHGSTS